MPLAPALAAPPQDAVLRALGFRPGRTRPSAAALEAVAAGMAEAALLLQPLVLESDAGLDCAGPDALLRVPAHGLLWRSTALVAVMGGAERVTLFCGTAGAAVTEAVRGAWNRGEYARAVVLDACGTAAVQEAMGGVLAGAAMRAASFGCRLTAPYSPGYGDWDVGDSAALLDALGARRIGLRASDASYLVPEKSFCGAVGWMRGRHDLPQASGCAICFLPGCRYRRSPPVGPPGVLARLPAGAGPGEG
jgi:hypothetical protein